jgi:hypothetical protein
MKRTFFLLFFALFFKNYTTGQVGTMVAIGGKILEKLMDASTPDLVYDATTHTAVVELKTQQLEQINQTVKLVKESYEISRTLKNSNSFLQGMSVIIEQNKELINKAGWISQSVAGLTIQAVMTEEIAKALNAQRRIMNAQLKSGDFESALHSAEQYYFNFEKFMSAAKRNFKWALKEGEDVSLTQAERLKFLEECDKNFNDAVKERKFMESLAGAMEHNAASQKKDDDTPGTKDARKGQDPELPQFAPKSQIQ